MMTPIAQALDGRGPLPAAAGAGLRVMASAPLHGGELPGMVMASFVPHRDIRELRDLTRRRTDLARAAGWESQRLEKELEDRATGRSCSRTQLGKEQFHGVAGCDQGGALAP